MVPDADDPPGAQAQRLGNWLSALGREAASAEPSGPSVPSTYPFPDLPITPAPPYSWAQTVAALSGFGAVPDRGRAVASVKPVHGARPGGDPAGDPPGDPAWELALRLEGDAGRLVTVRIEPAAGEGPLAPDLELHLTNGEDLTLGEADSIWRQLDQFLALALDLRPLAYAAAYDPAFEPVERALRGFHPPRFRSAFQAACWAVVRQRTPQKFAAATMARLAALLGDAAPAADGTPLPLFPAPAALARGARPALLAATNNVRKVERLEGLAAEFALVEEEELRRADYDDALKWLRALPGLGPWSAEQVVWRGLGRVERTPWRDTGALGAISAVYTPGLTLVRASARELARHYGELQGVWLSYLKAYPRVRGERS